MDAWAEDDGEDVLPRNFPRVLAVPGDGDDVVLGVEEDGDDAEGGERNLPRRGAAMGAGFGGAIVVGGVGCGESGELFCSHYFFCVKEF